MKKKYKTILKIEVLEDSESYAVSDHSLSIFKTVQVWCDPRMNKSTIEHLLLDACLRICRGELMKDNPP